MLNWFRTHMAIVNRGGATVTGFDIEDVRNAPDTWAGKISKERLWSTLEGFLQEVIPVCEEADVNLALHPGRPARGRADGHLPHPDQRRGLCTGSSPSYDSPRNGMTFCQGCFATMGEDVPAAIRHFGAQKKIYFVHFRDIQGDKYRFNEAFHDDGITDMYEAMRAYYEVGFDGIARPDHVPTLVGEDNANPSYGLMGNLFAVGYIKGLMESVEKQMGWAK